MNVNSTIQMPLDMDVIDTGEHLIKGIDKGNTWSNALLDNQNHTGYGWTSWSYKWDVLEKGEYTIMTRAIDSYNRTQPKTPFWNRKGYEYNAIDEIKVKVE